MADFYGFDFEEGFDLLGDEFEDIEAVYVIYTEQGVLEIGETYQLKTTLETHENTRNWVNASPKQQILVAFHPDKSTASRLDKVSYLQEKMNPKFRSKPALL
jgi:hypothetical protein